MTKRVAKSPQPSIDVLVENSSAHFARELARGLQRRMPNVTVRLEHCTFAYYGGPATEFLNEVFIFISAHKVPLLAVSAYPLKKIVDIFAEEIREWLKSRRRKIRYRFYIYGSDGAPVRLIEKDQGKVTTPNRRWKAHAREEGALLRRIFRLRRRDTGP